MKADDFDKSRMTGLSGDTAVFGVLGNPVSQSMSPLMHNRAFAFLGIDGIYLPFEVEDLEGAVLGMKALGIKGASVTHPFKTDVMNLLGEIDDTARRIGAVNTLIFTDEQIGGTNTDWIGAVRCLESLLTIEDRRFVVLGAGGAARAVVFGLTGRGGKVTVVNRSVEKARALADDFDCDVLAFSQVEEVSGDCLVNTTPIGMYPGNDETPVPKEILGRYRAVADIIYNPLETRLLREAAAAGCSVASGLEMFVFQGAEQFRLWTGKEPPVEEMRKVVLDRLSAP